MSERQDSTRELKVNLTETIHRQKFNQIKMD